jgi:tripartite-type tricarboxylate transporter receptor subunit TctC
MTGSKLFPKFGLGNFLVGSFAIGLIVCASLSANSASAAYPEKPIRIVVPFAPGGGTDLIARTLGQGIAHALGQPVLIDNKLGAGTIIGTDIVAKSAPDGYTVLIASFAHAVNPNLIPKLPYSPDKAFAPVVLIGRGPNVLVVRVNSPYRTVKDILVAAQASPETLTYASQGNGTSAHLAGELLSNLAKIKLSHVAYRGAGPAITDLLGGQVDMMFATAAAASVHVDSGKLRAIAVTSAERSPALAGIPTIAETVPGYAVESWYGLYVPIGTAAEVINKLNAATRKAVQSEAFHKKIEQEGVTVSVGSPEDLEAYVKREEARWRKIVRENNIKPD